MIHVPQEIEDLILLSDHILDEITRLRAKKRLSIAEWKRLIRLQCELSRLSPPPRFAWIDGKPVVDIPKTLFSQENKHEQSHPS